MMLTGKTLLRLDRCFWLPHRLLEFLRHSTGSVRKNSSEHILVIKFMGMGSLIHFASLCEAHHADKSKITLMTLAQHRDLMDQWGFENVLVIRTHNLFTFIQDCWRSMIAVRALRPRCIIDLEKCSRAVGAWLQILAWTSRSFSVSFESGRALSNSIQTIHNVKAITQHEIFLKGVERVSKKQNHSPGESTIRVNPKKMIINIHASRYLLARRYPLTSFVTLIQMLSQWNGALEFLLSGSKEEFDYAEELRRHLPDHPLQNMCGAWDLNQFTAALSDCALFITGDSGPLHLAVHMQIPTLAIWGPTQPQHFGYTDKFNLTHASLNLTCAPCMKHPDSSPAKHCRGKINCMQNLSPDIVFEKSISILSSPQVTRPVRWPAGVKTEHKPMPQLVLE